MGRGSVLKNFKNQLQGNDLLRQEKRKKGDSLQQAQRPERDRENLSAIREAFNPFNVKVDKKKKPTREEGIAGRPVSARSAAESQRKRTWDAEMRLKNKIGGLVDRRFGERDKTMSEEDKMVERFAREKLNRLRKSSSKKSFNIEDDSGDESFGSEGILTHGGKALELQDDFDEEDLGVYSDDGQEPERKRARSEREDAEAADAPARPKTKAEVMQEVIAKSKMHKLERQQQRQADDELVDNLNADFAELMAELAPAEEQALKEKKVSDLYDRNLQELAFEKRADPTDRTKTDEELRREDEERKKAAERATAARMEGDELDIDINDAKDDANLFGLQDYSDEEQDYVKEDGDDVNSEELDGREQHVNVPTDVASLRQSLKDSIDPVEKIRYFVKIATPSRGSGSKSQLQDLATAVLQYSLTSSEHFTALMQVLHETAPKFDVGMALANKSRDLLHEVKRKQVWSRRDLLLYCFIGTIFSTSDQWHVVATSAMLVMTQRLSQSVDVELKALSRNLFLCDLLLSYQRLSKRYVPEVAGYLLRALTILVPEHNARIAERYVRIPLSSYMNASCPVVAKDAKGVVQIGETTSMPDIAVVIARTAAKASSLWRSLEGFPEIFGPIRACLENVPHDGNPVIEDALSKLGKLLKFSTSERRFLELQRFKPIGIVTHAPLFDENYNPEIKGQSLDPERRELQKLKALHKKERKSTMREIRRDTEFESRQLLEQKRRDMAAYHDKLQRLEGQINGEEGAERNAYEREKQKRKRR